ncbi:MAG TPA: hypothetical protein VG937_17695 [Polyangiaceae bacterium]|nr:hypothetical protein [Polyangiaceae bacterium]
MTNRPISFPGRFSGRGFFALARCGVPGALGLVVLLGLPTHASAEPGQLSPSLTLAQEQGGPDEDTWEAPDPSKEIRLDTPPGFSLGLGAYGGLALLMAAGESRPHTIGGVLSRARYGYVELGALLELTERNQDEWRSVGGFAGAWLPYRNWIDVELAAGFAYRRYLNSDPRYGAGGYDIKAPSFLLRIGISDRTSEGSLGARLGGELVAAMDIGKREAEWRYDLGTGAEARVFRGTTPVGGFSIGIAVSAGFDVAFKSKKAASAGAAATATSW